jgi:hypothetical protein
MVKDQLPVHLLSGQIGNDRHQQPRRIGRGLDGGDPRALQEFVPGVARKHPVECFGDLSAKLLALPALHLVYRDCHRQTAFEKANPRGKEIEIVAAEEHEKRVHAEWKRAGR